MSFDYGPWGMWFRFSQRGPGLQALHNDNEPLFSERNGYMRFWRVPFCRYRVRLLERF